MTMLSQGASMNAPVQAPGLPTLPAKPIRVMIVDDSAGVRVVSTLARRNAEISFKALALGALDYIPKPDSNREITPSLDFRREVIRKIKSLGRARTQRAPVSDGAANVALGETRTRPLAFRQRPFSLVSPRISPAG